MVLDEIATWLGVEPKSLMETGRTANIIRKHEEEFERQRVGRAEAVRNCQDDLAGRNHFPGRDQRKLWA